MILRISRRLEHVRLMVTDTVGEGCLWAVSLAPRLILLDAQLPARDAHDLLVYLERSSRTASLPLAVLSGSEEHWTAQLCGSSALIADP